MRLTLGPRRRLTADLYISGMRRNPIADRLKDAGIDIVNAGEPADVIVHHYSGEFADGDRGAINAIRQRAASTPFLILAGPQHFNDATLAGLSQTEHLIPDTTTCKPLIRAIRQTAMLCGQADETAVRLQALASLGHAPADIVSPVSPAQTILLSEPGARLLPLMGHLSLHTSLRVALTRSQALQALETNSVDALCLVAAPNRRSQASFVKLLRRHSDLSSLPIIVFEKAPTRRHTTYWSEVGVDAVVNDNSTQLAAGLCHNRSAARRAAIWQTRLSEAAVLTDLGEPSRLASVRQFEATLPLRRQLSTPFTLGAIRLNPADGESHRSALSEAAAYLALAMRPTDMICRPAPDLFLMCMPDTEKTRGAAVLDAAAQMIADLKFGGRQDWCTFKAETATTVGHASQGWEFLVRTLIQRLATPVDPALTPA